MHDDIDERIGAIAAAQHGTFALRQISPGASEGRVRHRCRSGRWVRRHQGVYAVAGSKVTFEQRAMAAALAAGPGAVTSHLGATALHQFPDVLRETIEVSVPPGRQARVRGVVVHRPARLDALDVAEVDGIPVTSFARTLVDCTTRLSLGQVARALDAGLIAGRVSLREVELVLDGLSPGPNRRTSLIRALLDERGAETAVAESRPEMRVFRLLVAAGLPEPVQQHRVTVTGERFRLDLANPDRLVAIEYDGWDYHRSRSAFDRDRRRDRLLQLAGWTVLRFTSRTSDDEIATTVAQFVRFPIA